MTARRAANAGEEADHLLELYGGDAARISAMLQGQLTQLATRAQMLLQLAGLTITVTGFSGANIARSGTLARCPPRDAIIAAIEMRDRKTRAFGRSLALLILGLSLYIGSVSILLLGNLPRS